MKNTLDVLFRYLPLRICFAVNSLPSEVLEKANEIRIRRNAPISVTCGNKNILFDEKGRVCNVSKAICATDGEIAECLSKLTSGSLYTCDEYVASGYIPLAEGGRAGVCGRANSRGGFAEINSINLRMHRFLPDVAKSLVQKLNRDGLCGVLVCSPPAMGKTTFLRSAAYLLSSGKYIPPTRVGIADERGEISAGIDKSGLLDVISSMPKGEAINMLTRTMSPQIIICDEIGGSEAEPIIEAQNTGVSLIASAHCENPQKLLLRGRMKLLLERDLFKLCVILGYDGGYTCEIAETEAFL